MPQFPAVIDLSTLTGSTGASPGFHLDGIDADDRSGRSVASAGDVNGDGFADLIVGAYLGDPGGRSNAGESYVVFGRASGFGASLDLATLNGSTGFRLDGIDAGDRSGFSVASAGDVNGDGFADLIIGAYAADPGGDSSAGASYVVFGKASGFAASLDLATLNGSTGFRLDGIDVSDTSGFSVASAGDVNGDGFADLIIGAWGGDPGGDRDAGESYIVFGKASGFAASLDLATLDGSNGFRLDGIDAYDRSGFSVASAGDVNGDGFSDLIIGAFQADPGGDSEAGESYVIFGKASGFAASLDLAALNGTNGFRLDGIDLSDFSGFSVASAGDVNGDGFTDLIIGAYRGDPGGRYAAGESYVVFGKASGFGASLDLATLDGSNGFRLDGIDAGDRSGFSVASAGDVNGDGFADLIIGARYGDPGGRSNAGESYVVFGKASGFAASLDLATLNGSTGFRLDGIDASDNSGRSVASAGDVNGDGFADIIIGAFRGDPGGDSDAGESYVVFGRAPDAAVNWTGAAGNQTFRGGAFNDTISGLGGNDTIIGGLGADTLSGGTGNDTFIAIAADLVPGESIDGGADTDTLRIDGGGTVSLAGVTLTNLERITLINTTGTRLVVSNAAQAALVFSAAGADDTVAISSFGFWGDFSTLSNLKALHTAGVENVEWSEGGATNIARKVGGTTVITSTDTAGAEWKTGVLTFGADDKIASWVVEFDDGRVRTTTFADGKPSSETTTDPLLAQPWSSITRTWDANGVLSQEVIAYESGFTQTQNLVDGVRTEYKLEDAGNTAAWTSLSYHYNPAGQLTSFDTLADNGIHQETAYVGGVKTTHTTTDTLNIAAFDKEVQTFDAAGTSLTQREVTLDKGAAPLGDTFIETYANGQLQKYEYYDLDNSDTITSVVDIYQAGVLQTHTIDYDTGPTWVFGSAIDQTLTSTNDDEYIWGRLGADTFVFAPGNGTDRIMDFQDGVDKIDLTAYGIHSKADIDPSAITEPYGHLTIDLGGGNSIKIIGFSLAQFSDADFV